MFLWVIYASKMRPNHQRSTPLTGHGWNTSSDLGIGLMLPDWSLAHVVKHTCIDEYPFGLHGSTPSVCLPVPIFDVFSVQTKKWYVHGRRNPYLQLHHPSSPAHNHKSHHSPRRHKSRRTRKDNGRDNTETDSSQASTINYSSEFNEGLPTLLF